MPEKGGQGLKTARQKWRKKSSMYKVWLANDGKDHEYRQSLWVSNVTVCTVMCCSG